MAEAPEREDHITLWELDTARISIKQVVRVAKGVCLLSRSGENAMVG